MESNHNWEQYYKNTEGYPPRKELVEAMEFVSNKKLALDLGAGTLRDSEYLLREGFAQVIAVDSEPAVTERAVPDKKLQIIISRFEDFDFPADNFDLVNAQYSLPFTKPGQFRKVFADMKHSLKKDGIFAGQLFGDKDGWNLIPNMTFLTKKEVSELIEDMEVIKSFEEEKDGVTAAGEAKHWHLFHLILKKK